MYSTNIECFHMLGILDVCSMPNISLNCDSTEESTIVYCRKSYSINSHRSVPKSLTTEAFSRKTCPTIAIGMKNNISKKIFFIMINKEWGFLRERDIYYIEGKLYPNLEESCWQMLLMTYLLD